MRVAVIHDWLTGMRGGERVLEQLLSMLPGAEIFTLLHVPGRVSAAIERHAIHTSALSRVPAAPRVYRHLLPMFPALIERFDLRRFDLVVSSSHCVALGARVPTGVPHVCYCHSPMRYLYDQAAVYEGRLSWPVRNALAAVRPRLRRWDRASAQRVTHFIANSEHVRSRIQNIYGRDAVVVHPPVDISRFEPHRPRDDFYMTIAALVPYKRVDLIVRAFNQLQRPLVVVGAGPEQQRLRQLAGSNVRFTGWIDDAQVADLLGRARGFVHAGVEDFGIAMVEALAAGTPVIAHAAGGALEIVEHGETGVLYREPTAVGLVRAILEAETISFSPSLLRARAHRFRPERFCNEIQGELDRVLGRVTQAAAV